jgi:hypothetical protein
VRPAEFTEEHFKKADAAAVTVAGKRAGMSTRN